MVKDFFSRNDVILTDAARQLLRTSACKANGAMSNRSLPIPDYPPAGEPQRGVELYHGPLGSLQQQSRRTCDILMPKLTNKVSCGLRALSGAQAFAILRSYLSTLQKQPLTVCLNLPRSVPISRLD